MSKKFVVFAILVGVGTAIVQTWRHFEIEFPATELVLFGNVDLREISLAFNNGERIVDVLVQEGDRVSKGQVLARVETTRLVPQVNKAEAEAEAQRYVVERLHNGSRPEEIAQARANVDAAQADTAYEEFQFHRLDTLSKESGNRAVSRQEFDNTRFALSSTQAKLKVNQKALELSVIGPRQEDIKQAEWQLRADSAQLALLRKQLADAELLSPADAVVRTRIMEPGELASPQKPVYSLAVVDPKWVRTYVSDSDLGKLHPGMPVYISVDSFAGRRFEGWVGFISPIAEFTPKTVETTELRPNLVYEVRAFVKDAKDDLRLGMPATVHVPLETKEPEAKSQGLQ